MPRPPRQAPEFRTRRSRPAARSQLPDCLGNGAPGTIRTSDPQIRSLGKRPGRPMISLEAAVIFGKTLRAVGVLALWLLQPRRNVPLGMQHTPNVHVTVPLNIEDQIR